MGGPGSSSLHRCCHASSLAREVIAALHCPAVATCQQLAVRAEVGIPAATTRTGAVSQIHSRCNLAELLWHQAAGPSTDPFGSARISLRGSFFSSSGGGATGAGGSGFPAVIVKLCVPLGSSGSGALCLQHPVPLSGAGWMGMGKGRGFAVPAPAVPGGSMPVPHQYAGKLCFPTCSSCIGWLSLLFPVRCHRLLLSMVTVSISFRSPVAAYPQNYRMA